MTFLLRKIFLWLWVLCSICVLSNPLDIGKKNMILPYKGQGFITIVNRSDKVEYFRAVVSRVEVDEQGNLDYLRVNNPKELGLLVVPVNIKMQPMQKRKVRVVSLKASPGGSQRTYYHVDFDHITQESQQRLKQIESEKNQTSAMKVYINSKTEKSVVVDVGNPNEYNPKTNAVVDIYDQDKDEQGNVIEKNRVVITNTGNVMLWLTDFEVCSKGGSCKSLSWFKALYPGEKYKYILTDDAVSVRYSELFGSKRTKRLVRVP